MIKNASRQTTAANASQLADDWNNEPSLGECQEGLQRRGRLQASSASSLPSATSSSS